MQFVIPISNGAGTISRQVYEWFRRSILEGSLKGCERLPSTRDLSEQLGISRTVVLLAYEQLLAEGYVEGRAGSGTYVATGLTGERGLPSKRSANLHVSRYGKAALAVMSDVDFPRRRTNLPYDFSYTRTVVDSFPFETWRRILMSRARKAPAREYDYGPSAGSAALQEAIAAHLRRSRAVQCDSSQVIIVSGSQQALDLIARVFVDPGAVVAIEDPQYQGAREIFRTAGARLHPVRVDGDGLDPAKLPKRARVAFVTPSHQFPTGTVLPLPRRLALLDWAKRAGAVIVEDDYDGEFRYEGGPLESVQGLDREGRVIYVGTFSRTIFPALRIGYMVVPTTLIAPISTAKWLTDRHTATLEQETLAEFISSGAYERHLRRARRRNAVRREVLLESIAEHLGTRTELVGAGSGTHVTLWPKIDSSEEELVSRAAEQGVGVYGISKYYLRRPKRVGLLLGYSRMREQEIREGIRRLGKVI